MGRRSLMVWRDVPHRGGLPCRLPSSAWCSASLDTPRHVGRIYSRGLEFVPRCQRTCNCRIDKANPAGPSFPSRTDLRASTRSCRGNVDSRCRPVLTRPSSLGLLRQRKSVQSARAACSRVRRPRARLCTHSRIHSRARSPSTLDTRVACVIYVWFVRCDRLCQPSESLTCLAL